MESLFVNGDGLQHIVGLVQDGTAGGLIHTAALHADQTVLNDVQQADAVGAAQLVQVLQRGLLQIQALMAQMPQVLILGVVGLTVNLQGDVVGFGVIDFLITALDVPLTPRGDDGHFGCQGLEGQFKTDLIVALTGAAVADGVGMLFLGDVGQCGGDAGARMGGAQQVILILGVSLQAGPDVVFHIILLQVQNIQLGSACLESLLLQTVQFGALADIAGNGNDFAVVIVFFQPGNDDGSIQTAGVCQNDFFDVLFVLFHDSYLSQSYLFRTPGCCLPSS